MKKEAHFSKLANLKKDHANFDFVDITLFSDTELFIDPELIDVGKTTMFSDMSVTVNSFFDRLFEAFRTGDDKLKIELLSNAHERCETRLGYSSGFIGKGNTSKGLVEKFSELDDYINDLPISKAMDVPLFLLGFNKDGMSDLITNIIHKQLYDFTVEQCKKYGIKLNKSYNFCSWDAKLKQWISYDNKKCIEVDGKPILLIPKQIVRKDFIYGPENYIRKIVVKRKAEYMASDILGDMQSNGGENWRHDEFLKDVFENPGDLVRYHKIVAKRYKDAKLSDERLNEIVYL